MIVPPLDGPAIRNANRGDSRESIRRKKTIFITCERFARIASNMRFTVLSPPKRAIRRKGVRFGNPETICENRAIRANLYFARSPEKFCGFFLRICLGILHWKMAGIFGDFFLVSVSTRWSTKTPQKIRGKFGAKFGAKFGTKNRKIRETFVLQLFWPNESANRFVRIGPSKVPPWC